MVYLRAVRGRTRESSWRDGTVGADNSLSVLDGQDYGPGLPGVRGVLGEEQRLVNADVFVKEGYGDFRQYRHLDFGHHLEVKRDLGRGHLKVGDGYGQLGRPERHRDFALAQVHPRAPVPVRETKVEMGAFRFQVSAS